MADIYPPTVQRPALLKLVEALGVQDRTLCRDGCGDWQIKGRFGHIYAVPGIPWGGMEKIEGFQIYCMRETVRAWSAAQRLLNFCRVTQNGDMEGMLFLGRLPTENEAEIIRDTIGIRKKRELSEENLAQFIKSGGDTRRAHGAPRPPKRSSGQG